MSNTQQFDPQPPEAISEDVPAFKDIPEPRMACLMVGNGAASKPLQGYLDSHPELYMIPAYPLMYFYPHWAEWSETYGGSLTWPMLIDLLCKHHPSIINSRIMPGHNGLTSLGENMDQALAMDIDRFKITMNKILDGEEISSRTFLLAIHYAYALSHNEDISKKKTLCYHIHVGAYLGKYCIHDFPNLLAIFMVRDPRSNIFGRLQHSFSAVNFEKMNFTDAVIYRRRDFLTAARFLYEGLDHSRFVKAGNCVTVKAEDLHFRGPDAVRAVARFLGLQDDPCLEKLTFGGLHWWGDSIYNMKPMNEINPRMVSTGWKEKLAARDWFVIEGLLRNYFFSYGYQMEKYNPGKPLHKALLYLAMLLPSSFELASFAAFAHPKTVLSFIKAAMSEGTSALPLKPYNGNAFYRHKWTNTGLRLHEIRWYRRFLESNPSSIVARAVYIGANLVRYSINPLFFIGTWFARIKVCHKAYIRAAKGNEYFPRNI